MNQEDYDKQHWNLICEENFGFSNYQRPMFIIKISDLDSQKFCKRIEWEGKRFGHIDKGSTIYAKRLRAYNSEKDFFEELDKETERIYMEKARGQAFLNKSKF